MCDNDSRPSSCRSVVVGGEECPARYQQDSIKQVINQYQLVFPHGVKRSYIYAHIPKNYQSNTMLARLCNVCEDYGFSNFASLRNKLVQQIQAECRQQDLGGVMNSITLLQCYLKTKFAHEVLKIGLSCFTILYNFYFWKQQ